MCGVDPQHIDSALHQFERPMLFEGPIAIPEEVNSQKRVSVAPLADRFAAFGGDEAAADCAGC